MTCILVQFVPKDDSLMLKEEEGGWSGAMLGDNVIEMYSRGPLAGFQGA